MAIRQFCVFVCFTFVAWAPSSRAYHAASAISYDQAGETVYGYNRTWEDPWDVDYTWCLWEYWDDVLGQTCGFWEYQINFVDVSGAGVSTSTQYPSFYTDATTHSSYAEVEFAQDHVFTHSVSHIGTWTTNGEHDATAHIWTQSCPGGFCYPPVYYGSSSWHLDYTSAQTAVCVHNQSVIDSAALAVALAWPIGATERGVTMVCSSTGTVSYLQFNDSFGDYYSGSTTDDPCASGVVENFTGLGRAGDLHSHPKFDNTAQYNRGLGCYGDPTPRSTEFLQNYNLSNEQFSSKDILDKQPGSSYLKTPTNRILRRNNNGEAQIYP